MTPESRAEVQREVQADHELMHTPCAHCGAWVTPLGEPWPYSKYDRYALCGGCELRMNRERWRDTRGGFRGFAVVLSVRAQMLGVCTDGWFPKPMLVIDVNAQDVEGPKGPSVVQEQWEEDHLRQITRGWES